MQKRRSAISKIEGEEGETKGTIIWLRKSPQNENFMIYQEEPVAQRQEMVIDTLVLLWKFLMVVVKQGSGPR